MRPRLAEESIVYRTSISLRPGDDDDLIAFFARVPPRQLAAAIKTGLRSGGLLNIDVESGPDDESLLDGLDGFMD